ETIEVVREGPCAPYLEGDQQHTDAERQETDRDRRESPICVWIRHEMHRMRPRTPDGSIRSSDLLGSCRDRSESDPSGGIFDRITHGDRLSFGTESFDRTGPRSLEPSDQPVEPQRIYARPFDGDEE